MCRIFYISLPAKPRCCLPAQDTLHLPSAQNHVSLQPRKIYQARKTFCTALHLASLPLHFSPFPFFFSTHPSCLYFLYFLCFSPSCLLSFPSFFSAATLRPPPPPQSLMAPRPPYSKHQSLMMHCGRCCICNFIPFARNNTCSFLVRPSACSQLRRREILQNVNCLLKGCCWQKRCYFIFFLKYHWQCSSSP